MGLKKSRMYCMHDLKYAVQYQQIKNDDMLGNFQYNVSFTIGME